MEQPEGCRDALLEYVKNIRFTRINPTIVITPFVFLTASLILLLRGVYELLGSINRISMPVEGAATTQMFFIQWGLILLVGFTIAATLASYYLLKKLIDHLYHSSIATYYFTSGSLSPGLINYVENTLRKYTLPSPVTGLILSLLTAGTSYPFILLLSEGTLRDHIISEEKLLLGYTSERRYREAITALDTALLVLTAGLYGLYMAYRWSRLYNNHYEKIHKYHPNPPPTTPTSVESKSLGGIDQAKSVFIVVLALTPILSVVYTLMGILPQSLIPIATGLALGTLIYVSHGVSLKKTILISLLVLYILLLSGILTGVVSRNLTGYQETIERNIQSITEVFKDPLSLVAAIFTNNFAISFPSVIPIIGQYMTASGVYNAGFALGQIIIENPGRTRLALITPVLPHTILELLAYSILIASSRYMVTNTRKFIETVVVGVATLFLAAIVEVVTIMIMS